MSRQYRSSQRRGNQMARTNKTICSNRSDDHLGQEGKLAEDSIAQTARHTNKVRQNKGLPPHQIVDPLIGSGTIDDAENNKTIEDHDDPKLVDAGQLIVGTRAYTSGTPTSVTGDELVAIHRRLRRERLFFRELNGEMVEAGGTVKRSDASRKDDKVRKVPGILKSIMVRLMPAEAEAVPNMTRGQVEAAMDKTVADFEKATGCEVVTAVAHRMSPTDLHIHIQYTQVHPFQETTHMLGKRMKPWKQEASKIARESLLAEGVMNPGPATIGARKKKLIAEGLIPSPPEAHVEYRKVAGKRDLGDGAFLGYSFRQKLNLVRAAELGGEMAIAHAVAQRNDERFGRFTPIANRPDDELDAKYLDLWLERTWRRNVTSQLPEEQREKLVVAGVEAAKNYAQFGSSIVENTHIKRRIKELEEKAKEIEKAQADLDAKKIALEAKEAALKQNPPEEKIVVKEIVREVVPQSFLDDSAALRGERDILRIQTGESAMLISQVKSVLKPFPEETLLAAASRVITVARRAEALTAKAAQLATERNKFKTEAEQSAGILERIRAMLGLTPDADTLPSVKQVVDEVAEMRELKKQMGVLEKEIGPLRLLKKLFGELISYLNKSKHFNTLPNGIRKRLNEMADSVAIRIEMPGEDMK